MMLAHREICPGQGHEAGRQLLQALYEKETGHPLPEIRVTDRGKPYFPGNEWYFSITHTAHHVFCVLSKSPVGMDAEEVTRTVKPRLADKILSPGEREKYLQAPDRNAALLKLWVLKEAWVKLLGTGLTGYPRDTDFSPEDERITEQHGCYVAILEHPQGGQGPQPVRDEAGL